MKTKLLFVAALTTAASYAQTVSVTVTTTFQQSVMADVLTHYTDQHDRLVGTAGSAIASTDTSISLSQASLSQAAALPTVGDAILCDSEPMTVTAVTVVTGGATLTVTRAPFPNFTAAAHASGANIYVLKYVSPWAMVAQEALRPWAQGLVASLAAQNRSNTFSSTASGSVQ